MGYKDLCWTYHYDSEKLIRVKPLFNKMSKRDIKACFEQMQPNTFFVAEEGGIPEDCTYILTVLRTKDSLYVYNNELIIKTRGGVEIHNNQPTEADWRLVFDDIGPTNLIIGHYNYLEIVIGDFWKRIFNKTTAEMWCDGIITSHGDKAYGYRYCWEEVGISFNRGVLLFLLTYTKLLGDTPKHKSREWVMEKYQEYLPHILEAEKGAGL